jgi:hypothetical protein
MQHFSKLVQLPDVLRRANIHKTRGIQVPVLFEWLITTIFTRYSIFRAESDPHFTKKTARNCLNNRHTNWQRLVILLAVRLIQYVKHFTDTRRAQALILDDYYIDPQGVRFNFQKYVARKDKTGFTRQFHRYLAEAIDENQQPIPAALTKGGRTRYIDVNPEWEFFKAQQRAKLTSKTEGKIYARRKIDVESVFGHLKAYLHFTRFTVRGNIPVKRQMVFMLMAMNLGKVAKQLSALSALNQIKRTKARNLRDFRVLVLF